MNRREFLQLAAGVTVFTSKIMRPKSSLGNSKEVKSDRSTVVIVRKPEVYIRPKEVSPDIVRQMLDQGITRLTGFSDVTKAWQSICSTSETIGIKVNAMGGRNICTHAEVAYAAAESLVNAGIKPQQIILWDRITDELRRGGYTINRDGPGIRCFGTDSSYEREPAVSGSIGSCFSTILSRQCDCLISIPVLKDHDLCGVSLSLKNFYGAIHNPNKYHDHGCDPYIADVNAHPYIKDKLRLVICDGLIAQCNGGPGYKPQWAWPYSGLLLSRDPVAIDRTGCHIIEEQRKATGLQSLAETGRPPQHIQTAAQRGLGISDMNKINKIIL
jgi:uncharacterized protein (DUF362 family)